MREELEYRLDKDLYKEIDEYRFYPEYKIQLGDRLIVQLHSILIEDEDDDTSFQVYTSNSEGGTWRYLYIYKGSFFKGKHYVTETFIHIKLQQFLDTNILKIKSHPSENPVISGSSGSIFREFKKRVISTPALDIMNMCNMLNENQRCFKVRELKHFFGLEPSPELANLNIYAKEPYFTIFRNEVQKHLLENPINPNNINDLLKIYYLSVSSYLRNYITIINPYDLRFLYSNTKY